MNVPHIAWWSRKTRTSHEPANDDGGSSDFESLVQRQSRFVFRVAYAIVRNSYDAEDIVQETFLKLYRSNAWHRIEDEKAFLARTTWRLAIDRLTKHKEQDSPAEISLHDLESAAPSPEQTALSSNTSAVLHRLIDSLPEELRQPLALSAIEELNSRQIADAMGIPEGTVRTRLMRARQILKDKLTAAGVT